MMMRRILNIAVSSALALAAVSCVFDNDMSYPRLKGEITAFAVEGQKEVTINPDSLTVDVLLEETAEIDSLKITEYQLSEMAVADTLLGEYIDLSNPVKVMLSTYPGRDYLWTISASQPIERFVKCSGLIEATFDGKNQTVMVAVTESQPLDEIVITDMKIMQETSKILTTTGYDAAQSGVVTTDVKFPMTLDCTLSRQFTVLYKGVEYVWTVTFVQQKIQNQVKSVDAWANHAVVSGEFDGVGEAFFEYRKASEDAWIAFKSVDIVGVNITGSITELEENTDYVVRLVSPSCIGEDFEFKTYPSLQLSNMSFEDWSIKGNTYYPFAEDATIKDWATANQAVSAAGAISGIYNTTIPVYDHVVDGKTAAMIKSEAPAGVFAAGNLFTGEFDKFESMTAYLKWGVPFKSKPYSLKGYYDYSPATVNKVGQKYIDDPDVSAAVRKILSEMEGKMDIMQLLAVLVAEGEPYLVNSNLPGKPDLLNDSRVIAYGTIERDENTSGEYKEFEIVFEYRDNREPAYIILVACSSLYGNYFTGGVGSTLYVDGFKFTYR